MKKKKMEVFDPLTGKWTKVEMTDDEIESFQALHEDDVDVLEAEYQIIQRSIAMHVGTKQDTESTD
tara:strand:- start:282 stop:479 length:198 start_codon:yes stop_codon:yes gene_type:complete